MNMSHTPAKKITALAALPFVAALGLSACGSEEAAETSFTQSQNGIEMTLTYTHVGDEVTKQTASNEIDYEAAGFGSKEEAQELLEMLAGEAEDIEGYEQSIEYGDTKATEELVIDYEVVDISELEGVPGFEGSADMGDADYVSLEKSTEALEQAGFTLVE
jgi:uncharacterized lipoprotein YehR (DUF1307 family)